MARKVAAFLEAYALVLGARYGSKWGIYHAAQVIYRPGSYAVCSTQAAFSKAYPRKSVGA